MTDPNCSRQKNDILFRCIGALANRLCKR